MATVSTPLRIGPSDQGRTMTLQEFLEAEEEEGYRYELARGVLEVTEVPNDPHGVTVSNLYTGSLVTTSNTLASSTATAAATSSASGSLAWSRAAIPTSASSYAVPPRISEAGGSPRWPPRSCRGAASIGITSRSERNFSLTACSNTGSSTP